MAQTQTVGIVGKVTSFDLDSGNWQTYCDRLDMYFLVNKVSEEMKLPTLISGIGDPAYELMVNLCSPKKPCEYNYTEVIKIMADYLQPKPSVVAERFKFRQCKQSAGQSVANFMAELKKASKYCDFGATLDDNMRDQFVCGVSSDFVRQRLFADEKLTYNRAVKLATNLEAAERNSHAIGDKDSTNERNEVKTVHKMQTVSAGRGLCEACGDPRHYQKECKFSQYVCDVCKIKGHLRRMCPQVMRGSGFTNPANGLNGSRRGDWGRGAAIRARSWRGGRSGRGGARSGLHWLQARDSDADREYCMEGEREEDGEAAMNLMSLSQYKPVCIRILVNNQVLSMEVDTGSALSCISGTTYSKYFANCTLNPCQLRLKFYDGSIIRPLGYIEVDVVYENKKKSLDLYVIDNGCTSLLGRQWLAELGIDIPPFEVYNFSLNDGSIVRKSMDKEALLSDVLSRHKPLFDSALGRYTGGKASLCVRDGAQPIFCRARPLPYALRARVDAELDAMLAAGVIEPVDHSDWATPLVIARKADGGIRVCADYKITLNKALLVDRYPVPKIEDLFTNLSNNAYFTKLDLSHAYNQYELDEASKCYTVINTHRGLFKYNRLVYGLSSSPGIFQKMMQTVLQGIPNVINFLDDILITGADLDSHLKTINEVFRRLHNSGLKLKKSKCVFLADKVTFLGFKVDKQGVSVDTEKIKPIVEMSAPRNVAELRSFLGMVNFYGKFVRNLSSYLHPLYQLVKKGVHWSWDKEHDLAFKQVKRLLVSTDVLVHFDISQQTVVTCDASSRGVGAVLAARASDGSERVVAYASRSLTAHELHYSQIHKEALAIVFAVSKFHQYLYGRRFTLRTDHKPLVSIFGPNCGVPVTAASRLQRWAIVLSAYDFDIEYVSTEKNTADALSRLIKSHKDEVLEEAGQIPEQTYLHFAADAFLLDYNKLKTSTASDPVLSRVLSYIKDGWPADCEVRELGPYFNRKNELYTELGCIMWGHRVIIPASCRDKVLRELHEAHMGIVKTKSLARGYVWWPGLDEAIEAQCRECGVCASASSAPPAHAPRLWTWPDRPWTRIHLDFLGPIRGQTYLIVVDAYSKWIEAIRMNSTSAGAVIRVLRELWSRFGIPKQVVSDNGPPYSSTEFKSFLLSNGVDQVLSAPYHPASNGAAESAVKICKGVIIKSFKENVNAETALCRFLLQYRNTEHSTTGESPAKLLQGRSLRNRLDCLRPDRGGHVRTVQERQRRAAGGVERELPVGDPVWVRQYRGNEKWVAGTIRDRRGDTDYLVDTSNGTGVHRHIDQLKSRRVTLNNGGGNSAKRNSLIFPDNGEPVAQSEMEVSGRTSRAGIGDGAEQREPDHDSEAAAVDAASPPSARTAIAPCASTPPARSANPSPGAQLLSDSSIIAPRAPRVRKPPRRFGFEDLFTIRCNNG